MEEGGGVIQEQPATQKEKPESSQEKQKCMTVCQPHRYLDREIPSKFTKRRIVILYV